MLIPPFRGDQDPSPPADARGGEGRENGSGEWDRDMGSPGVGEREPA